MHVFKYISFHFIINFIVVFKHKKFIGTRDANDYSVILTNGILAMLTLLCLVGQSQPFPLVVSFSLNEIETSPAASGSRTIC